MAKTTTVRALLVVDGEGWAFEATPEVLRVVRIEDGEPVSDSTYDGEPDVDLRDFGDFENVTRLPAPPRVPSDMAITIPPSRGDFEEAA